jgi:DNA polymerase III subunit gamma/tau
VLAAFPGALITAIRTPEDLRAAAATDALPGLDDEWDPFEDA